jgi:four helix bundle protein
MALGSLTEVQNQLLIAKDLKYLTRNDFDILAKQIITVHKLLNTFIAKTKTYV